MSNYNIEELIKAGESETVEFKSIIPPVQGLSKLISSFANTQGGIIVFGIYHDVQVVGISIREDRFIDICNSALNLINPKPKFNIIFEKYQNKTVAILEIGRSDDIVVSSDNIAYFRENTVSKPITSKKIIEKVKHLPLEEAVLDLSKKIEDQSKTIIELTEQLKKANKPWKKIVSTLFGFLLGILASYIANQF